MSDIYNSLYSMLEPERYDKSTPMDMRRIELGLALESMLEQGIKARLSTHVGERPGEQTTEMAGRPVHYNPDLFLFDDNTFRVGEIKYSSMSNRQGVSHAKFNKWFTQMKLYCNAVQTPYARLYGFFSNGDYTHPYTPSLNAYDIEFTPRELRDEWDTAIAHGRNVGMFK